MVKSAKTSDRDQLSAATRFAILHGPERFLQDLHIQKLRDALVEAQGGDDAVQVVRFDGAPGGGGGAGAGAGGGGGGGGGVADILDECRSMGLMTAFKLVIVDNADLLLKSADDDEDAAPAKPAAVGKRSGPKHRSNRELMEAYAAEPCDSATLVLRANTWRPGNLDKTVAKLGEHGAVIKCEPPDEAQAASWAIRRCKERHNAELTREAAALLVENLGAELGRIDAELGKLALVDPGKPIGIDAIRQFVGMSREEEFWAIQRTLLSGDAAAALRHLRDMIEVSRHDPVPLGWAFTDLARKVHGLSRGMAQGANPFQLKGALRIWGPEAEVEQLLRVAKRVKPRAAAALLRAAVENDAKLKSSQGDPVVNLEALALRFTSALR